MFDRCKCLTHTRLLFRPKICVKLYLLTGLYTGDEHADVTLLFFLSGCVRRDSEISYNRDAFLGLFSSPIQALRSFISFYYIARNSTQPIADSVIVRMLRNLVNHVNDVHANSICSSPCGIFFSDKWLIATE